MKSRNLVLVVIVFSFIFALPSNGNAFLTASPNYIKMGIGESRSIAITGDSGSYSIEVRPSDIVITTLLGSTLYVQGNKEGTGIISINRNKISYFEGYEIPSDYIDIPVKVGNTVDASEVISDIKFCAEYRGTCTAPAGYVEIGSGHDTTSNIRYAVYAKKVSKNSLKEGDIIVTDAFYCLSGGSYCTLGKEGLNALGIERSNGWSDTRDVPAWDGRTRTEQNIFIQKKPFQYGSVVVTDAAFCMMTGESCDSNLRYSNMKKVYIKTDNFFRNYINYALYVKKDVITQPCTLNSLSITPLCTTQGSCKAGDKIRISASTINCPASYDIQVDIKSSDERCIIENTNTNNIQGFMKGAKLTCTDSSCSGEWTIPEIPQACSNKAMNPKAAAVRAPSSSEELGVLLSDIKTSGLTGSFTFGSYESVSQNYEIGFETEPNTDSGVRRDRLVNLIAYLKSKNTDNVYTSQLRSIDFRIKTTDTNIEFITPNSDKTRASCITREGGKCYVIIDASRTTPPKEVTIEAVSEDPSNARVIGSKSITFIGEPTASFTMTLTASPVTANVPGSSLLTARIRSNTNEAIKDQIVRFRIVSGRASLNQQTCQTNDDGECSVTISSVTANDVMVEAVSNVLNQVSQQVLAYKTVFFRTSGGTLFNRLALSASLDGTALTANTKPPAGANVVITATAQKPDGTTDTSYTDNIVFTFTPSSLVSVTPNNGKCTISSGGACSVTITGLSDGAVTIRAVSDSTPKKATDSQPITIEFSAIQESVPPETKVECKTASQTAFGECGAQYTESVEVRITCMDKPDTGNRGCDKTYLCIGADTCTPTARAWSSAVTEIKQTIQPPASGQAITTIKYYSVDKGGAKENDGEALTKPIRVIRISRDGVCVNPYENHANSPNDCPVNFTITQVDETKSDNVEFRTTISPSNQIKNFAIYRVCDATKTREACESDFRSPAVNNCGPGKACLCGAVINNGQARCTFSCYDKTNQRYFVLADLRTDVTYVKYDDDFSYNCPQIGLAELDDYINDMSDALASIKGLLSTTNSRLAVTGITTAERNELISKKERYSEAKLIAETWLQQANSAKASLDRTAIGNAKTDYRTAISSILNLICSGDTCRSVTIQKLQIGTLSIPQNSVEGRELNITIRANNPAPSARYGLTDCILSRGNLKFSGHTCKHLPAGATEEYNVAITPGASGSFSVACTLNASSYTDCRESVEQDSKTGTISVTAAPGKAVKLSVSVDSRIVVNRQATMTIRLLDVNNNPASATADTRVTVTTTTGNLIPTNGICTISRNSQQCTIGISSQSTGTATIMAVAEDMQDGSASIQFIEQESEKPSTSIRCNNAECIARYTNSVRITFSCQDSGSGCRETKYCIDRSNTCNPSTPYTTPFDITSSGTNYIRYYSTDFASNQEAVQNISVIIDVIQCGNNICEPGEACTADCNGLSRLINVRAETTETGVKVLADVDPSSSVRLIVCDAARSPESCRNRFTPLATSCGVGRECLCGWQLPSYANSCEFQCHDTSGSYYVIAARSIGDNRIMRGNVLTYSCPEFREQELRRLLSRFSSFSAEADELMQVAINNRAAARTDAERQFWDNYRNVYQDVKLIAVSHVNYMTQGLSRLTLSKSREMLQKSDEEENRILNLIQSINTLNSPYVIRLSDVVQQARVNSTLVVFVTNNISSIFTRYALVTCTATSPSGTQVTGQSRCLQLIEGRIPVSTNITLSSLGTWNISSCHVNVSFAQNCGVSLRYDSISNGNVSVYPPPNLTIAGVTGTAKNVSYPGRLSLILRINNTDIFSRMARVECLFQKPDGTDFVNRTCVNVSSSGISSSIVNMAPDTFGRWDVSYCSVGEAADSNCTSAVLHDRKENISSFFVVVRQSLTISSIAPINATRHRTGEAVRIAANIRNFGNETVNSGLECTATDPDGLIRNSRSAFRNLTPGSSSVFEVSFTLNKGGVWTLLSCSAIRKINPENVEDTRPLSNTITVFQPECTTNNQCPAGYVCESERCVQQTPPNETLNGAECSLYSECPGTISKCYCASGSCVACSEDEICENNACLPASQPPGVDLAVILLVLVPVIGIGAGYYTLIRRHSS